MASRKMKIVRDLLTTLVEKTIELVHDKRKNQEEKDQEILSLIENTSKKIVREDKKKDAPLDAPTNQPKHKGQYTKEQIREMFAPLIEEEKKLRTGKRKTRK